MAEQAEVLSNKAELRKAHFQAQRIIIKIRRALRESDRVTLDNEQQRIKLEEVLSKNKQEADRIVEDLVKELEGFIDPNWDMLMAGQKGKTLKLRIDALRKLLTSLVVEADEKKAVAALRRRGLKKLLRLKYEINRTEIRKHPELVARIHSIKLTQYEHILLLLKGRDKPLMVSRKQVQSERSRRRRALA